MACQVAVQASRAAMLCYNSFVLRDNSPGRDTVSPVGMFWSTVGVRLSTEFLPECGGLFTRIPRMMH